MKRTIYLAGLISTVEMESLHWRERIAPKLTAAGFTVTTPLHGKTNLEAVTKDGGITASCASSKSILTRDYRDVGEADVVLVHLETFGSARPLLGTIAELAWAWQMHKPVVAIARPDNYLMRRHPFMSEFVTEYVPNEDEAVAFITRYY